MTGRYEDTLVVATTNRGKLEELRALLGGLPVAVRSIGEVMKDPPTVVEDGAKFADNAIKKASTAMSEISTPVTTCPRSRSHTRSRLLPQRGMKTWAFSATPCVGQYVCRLRSTVA